MDLVAGVKRVVAVRDHTDKEGNPKLLATCDLPLTGAGVVDLVVTDLAVFALTRGRADLRLIELAGGHAGRSARQDRGAVRRGAVVTRLATGAAGVVGDARGTLCDKLAVQLAIRA